MHKRHHFYDSSLDFNADQIMRFAVRIWMLKSNPQNLYIEKITFHHKFLSISSQSYIILFFPIKKQNNSIFPSGEHNHFLQNIEAVTYILKRLSSCLVVLEAKVGCGLSQTQDTFPFIANLISFSIYLLSLLPINKPVIESTKKFRHPNCPLAMSNVKRCIDYAHSPQIF